MAPGSQALKLCKFADANGVVQSSSALNTQLWVGKKHCKIADLQAKYPKLCWPALMSHLRGNSRFSVCMQHTHADHLTPTSAAHVFPAGYEHVMWNLFQ
jgi:hypothetical protein